MKTDSELKQDVENKIIAAFHRNADIDARRIEVQAQSAAWAAPGVTAVENDIVVVP